MRNTNEIADVKVAEDLFDIVANERRAAAVYGSADALTTFMGWARPDGGGDFHWMPRTGFALSMSGEGECGRARFMLLDDPTWNMNKMSMNVLHPVQAIPTELFGLMNIDNMFIADAVIVNPVYVIEAYKNTYKRAHDFTDAESLRLAYEDFTDFVDICRKRNIGLMFRVNTDETRTDDLPAEVRNASYVITE